MEIKDLQCKVMKVTNLQLSIIQVQQYLSYRYEQREKSLIDFEHQRLTYWRDVYKQLVVLRYEQSDKAEAMPEFITEESSDAWVCKCGHKGVFYLCDSIGNEMRPSIGADSDELYICDNCGRIIHGNTLQVVGQKEA
jgi:hypothetical protein